MTFLICVYKSLDFVHIQQNFEQSHDWMTATFRASAILSLPFHHWPCFCHTINWLAWQAGKSWEFTDCIRRRQKCYQKSRGDTNGQIVLLVLGSREGSKRLGDHPMSGVGIWLLSGHPPPPGGLLNICLLYSWLSPCFG